MFTTRIKRFLLQRALKKSKIPLKLWHKTIATMPIIQRYSRHEKMQLRLLASQILTHKTLTAVHGFFLSDLMRTTIATQAAIVIFGLENPEEGNPLDWIRNWKEIIVYPNAFHNGRPPHFNQDGIMEDWAGIESGETQYQGGIIISWQDTQPHPLHKHANQVLMHEMAHKLDMLNGATNGHPPLHRNMNNQAWFDAFSDAFNQLNHQLQHNQKPSINPYAATNPAEFFAVTTEYFFEAPKELHKHYPLVYQQLALFYKQDL